MRNAECGARNRSASVTGWAFQLTPRANGFQDRLRLRELAGGQLRVDFFAIDDHFKRAATRRDERERFDRFFEPQEFLRQTDGMRLVVSSSAILNDHFCRHKLLRITSPD